MATDHGLVYLSGLLRAGSEPLGAAGRAPRRAAAPHASPSAHASSSYPLAPSERAGAYEAPRPLGADAPESDTRVAASQTNADDASAGHAIPADSGETAFAKQPEGSGPSHIAPSSATLDERVAESAAPVVPPPHTSRRGRAPSTSSSNTDAGVEDESSEVETVYVPPAFTTDTRSSAGGYEGITPVTSRVAVAAGEVRAAPEEEIWVGETQHTAVVTEYATVMMEDSAVAASEGERPSGTPRLLSVEWSPAPLQEGAINPVASRAEVERAVEDTTTTDAADTTAMGAAPGAPGASPVRGLATRHEQTARVFHAPPEERRRRRESELAPALESDAAQGGASARGVADSAVYTLEAHVEQLRALMQTSRAESSSGAGEGAAGAAQPAAAQSAIAGANNEMRARAAAWSARESPRGELRPESAARPPAVPSPKSDSRQPVVLESPGRLGATAGRGTSATELPGGAPVASERKSGAGAAPHEQETKRPPVHVSPTRPVGSHAHTLARIGIAQPREGGTPGVIKAGGARAPKLTINRLDVQVVNQTNLPPPARPAPPAPAPPPQPDPWGAQDRLFLGRFFY